MHGSFELAGATTTCDHTQSGYRLGRALLGCPGGDDASQRVGRGDDWSWRQSARRDETGRDQSRVPGLPRRGVSSLGVRDALGPSVDVESAKRSQGVEYAVVERWASEQVLPGRGGDGVGHAGRVLEEQLIKAGWMAWNRLSEQRLELALLLFWCAGRYWISTRPCSSEWTSIEAGKTALPT